MKPNSAGTSPYELKEPPGCRILNVAGRMGAKIRNKICQPVFPSRIWTDGLADLRDWEHTRGLTPLGGRNRRQGLTPGPDLSEPQADHHQVCDFQDDLLPRPDHLGCDVNHHSAHQGNHPAEHIQVLLNNGVLR